MKKNYSFRLETPNDYFNVENLVRESFWNVYRPGCSEHFVLHKLRDNNDFIKDLDILLVMKDENGNENIIGQVVFVKAFIKVDGDAKNIVHAGKELSILTFGPICIANEYKRKEYGKILLDYAIDKAISMGFGGICMEGNINFYSHCGFSKAYDRGIYYHDMDRKEDCPFLLVRELKKGYFDGIKGTYYTPDAYFVDDKDVDEYDKKFPKKEKLKLNGQIFS